MDGPGDVVFLRVGGELFATPRPLLLEHDSMLRSLVAGQWNTETPAGEILVDRSPGKFRRLLFILSSDELPFSPDVCKDLLEEADFFSLTVIRDVILKAYPLLGTSVRLDPCTLYACRFAVPADGPPPFENCLLAVHFEMTGKYEFFQTEEQDEFWVKDYEGVATVHDGYVSLDYRKDSQLFTFHVFHSPVDQHLVLQVRAADVHEPLFGCLIADSKAIGDRIAYTKSDFV
jgi:hypothetical protein